MAEFFVAKTESEDLGNLVHDKDCSQLTSLSDFKYLGSYASSDAASKKAAGLYYRVSLCPACLGSKAAADDTEAAA